jgi:hypothetical protein
MSNKMGRQAMYERLKFLQSDKRREPYVSPTGVNQPTDSKKYGRIPGLDIEELEKKLAKIGQELNKGG